MMDMTEMKDLNHRQRELVAGAREALAEAKRGLENSRISLDALREMRSRG